MDRMHAEINYFTSSKAFPLPIMTALIYSTANQIWGATNCGTLRLVSRSSDSIEEIVTTMHNVFQRFGSNCCIYLGMPKNALPLLPWSSASFSELQLQYFNKVIPLNIHRFHIIPDFRRCILRMWDTDAWWYC